MSRKRKKKAKAKQAAAFKPAPVVDKPNKQILMGMERPRPEPTIMYYSYTLYPKKKAKKPM